MTAIQRLVVVSPNWLGDAVMALPAVTDLRRGFPRARLIVAARKGIASLFTMSPAVDEVVTLEWGGRLFSRRSRAVDVAVLRACRADVAVLLPNSFASAWLLRRAGIRQRWGYRGDARQWLLSRAVPRPRVRVHQAEYYRRLVNALGIENGPLEAGIVVAGHAIERARSTLHAAGWDESRPFVVMAPGAAYGGAKRWPAEQFAEVATRLVRDDGMQCVLIGSPGDAAISRWVRAAVPENLRADTIDLAGATTLETLAAVLSLASACVSNDSGAMHLAAAVGVPLAAIFGPTRERETAPLPRRGRRVEVLVDHVWCRPCMLRECPLDHRCMKRISPERVLATVIGLAKSPEPRAVLP